MMCGTSARALTLYYDNFQSYPLQDPSPNPLTNGPAGGQWCFVNPYPLLLQGEHYVWNATAIGCGFNSHLWATKTNLSRLTNAISLSKLANELPAFTNSNTIRLSFAVATDTSTVKNNSTFAYNFSFVTASGTWSFVSGSNADGSQVLAGPSGTAIATAGATGKSADRVFQFVFQTTNLSPDDKFIFDITFITNNGGSIQKFVLDDVVLSVDDATPPAVLSVSPTMSLQHARVAFSEPVDPATATNTANYSIPGLSVQNAWLLDPRTVEIQTADQVPGTTYTVTMSGVLGSGNGLSIPATSLSFTAPALSISAVRYDAGTTTTQPSGPPDPLSNNWTRTVNNSTGMSTGPVSDDNGTGFNAWTVTDNNSTSGGGVLVYNTPIDQASKLFASTNGWRIVMRSRYTQNFGAATTDQLLEYGEPALSQRYGILLGLTNDTLMVNMLGGAGASSGPITLLTDSETGTNYHTHVLAYNPATGLASYYFDGRLILDFEAQTAVPGRNGLSFGGNSSGSKGEVNYNLVQMDVVNATAPVVALQPVDTSAVDGFKATFTALFSPFVNSCQWLSNDVAIPGATSTNYTTGVLTLANSGTQYKLRAFCALGNVDTLAAQLTVLPQTNPPTILSVTPSPLKDRVTITFSEVLDSNSATNVANYSASSAGVSIVSVQMVDLYTVEVHTTPLTAGSLYSLQISNVQNSSNVPIAANTPVMFFAPHADVVARYYAGSVDDAPAGPPNPLSVEGGSWSHLWPTNDNLTTNAVVNDAGMGWNAWEVADNSYTSGLFNYFYKTVSAANHAAARKYGWVLSMRVRLVDSGATTPSAIMAFYGDDKYFRNTLSFNTDVNGNLMVGLSRTNGWNYYTVTSDNMGSLQHHLHQVVYNPATKTTSYYCDGTLIQAGWPSYYVGSTSLNGALMWGANSSGATGTADFNLIEFDVVQGPVLSMALNGSNIEVSYRGILEATSQLGQGAAWTAVATNSTTATNIYTLPASSAGAQFFRARMLQ